MKNGEITVRFAAENELARVNELREQVSRLHAEKFCRISEFGVDAALRRRGAASAMIDFCRTEAKKRKLERLEPDVWSFNRDAVRFYEAAGFETYRQYTEVKP